MLFFRKWMSLYAGISFYGMVHKIFGVMLLQRLHATETSNISNFRGSFYGLCVKLPQPKTRQDHATNLKFGTQVHTYVVSEKMPYSTKTP